MAGSSQLCGPGRAERLAVQMVQLRRDPGRRMNAVRHAADGDLVGRQSGPEVLPHLASHASMLAADAVDMGTTGA